MALIGLQTRFSGARVLLTPCGGGSVMADVFGNDVFMSGSVGGIYFFADFDLLVPRRLAIVEGINRGIR